jgi:hypothetical protein
MKNKIILFVTFLTFGLFSCFAESNKTFQTRVANIERAAEANFDAFLEAGIAAAGTGGEDPAIFLSYVASVVKACAYARFLSQAFERLGATAKAEYWYGKDFAYSFWLLMGFSNSGGKDAEIEALVAKLRSGASRL